MCHQIEDIEARYRAWGVVPTEGAREEVPSPDETRYYMFRRGKWVHVWTAPSYRAFVASEISLLKQMYPTVPITECARLADQTYELYTQALDVGIGVVLQVQTVAS